MLVKLAFAMQRWKKISKKIFVMINNDGGGQFLGFMGGTAVMREDIELMGGSPLSPPPLGKTLLGCDLLLRPTFAKVKKRQRKP